MGDVASQDMGLDIYLSPSGKFARLPAPTPVKQDLATHELDRDMPIDSIAKKRAKPSNAKRSHSFLRPLVIAPVLITFIVAGGIAFGLPFTNNASNPEGISKGAAAIHQPSSTTDPSAKATPVPDAKNSTATTPSSPSARRMVAPSTARSSGSPANTPSASAVLPATDTPQPAESTPPAPQPLEEPTSPEPTEEPAVIPEETATP